MTITNIEASRRLLEFAESGRLQQLTWHSLSKDGRELACILGSISPEIRSPEQCPASVMPVWMASLVVNLFDGQAETSAMAWAKRFGMQMGKWHTLHTAAWNRVLHGWLLDVMELGLNSARRVAATEPYWPTIQAAYTQVRSALCGNGELVDAGYAARAATKAISQVTTWNHAADTAWGTVNAIEAAYRTNVVDTARNAVHATGAAAWGAGDADMEIAHAKAWATFASRLCDRIDVELMKETSIG